MARLIPPPILIPSYVGSNITASAFYNNPASAFNTAPFQWLVTLVLQTPVTAQITVQGTSYEDSVPVPYFYNAFNVEVGMWIGQPSGFAYRIMQIYYVAPDGLSLDVIIEDVDLLNLVTDNSGLGNNQPINDQMGVIFSLGDDGIPVLEPITAIAQSQLGDPLAVMLWVNDIHDRFRFRNYYLDYFYNYHQ